MEHNEISNLAFRIFSLWNMIYIALCAVLYFLLTIAAFTEGSVAYFLFAICLLVVAPVGWALNRMFLGFCQDLRLIRQMTAMSTGLPLNSEETDIGLSGEIAREFREIKKVKEAAAEAITGTSKDSKASEDEPSLDPDGSFEDPKSLSLLALAGIVLGLVIVLLIMVIQLF